MWAYEKRLQYPVKITKTCPKTAQLIISQYGGPDGELSASMRYLAQRYSMPVKEVGGLLTDIGTEELAHMEIICAMVYQLTKHLTVEQAQEAGFDAYYIDHTAALWPQAAAGVPFTALEFQSKGDAIADLTEDLAAEQKARTVYDNLLRMITDPEVREPLKFLRTREIVHFQRFGEALEKTKDKLDPKNFYYFNPEFDKEMKDKSKFNPCTISGKGTACSVHLMLAGGPFFSTAEDGRLYPARQPVRDHLEHEIAWIMEPLQLWIRFDRRAYRFMIKY